MAALLPCLHSVALRSGSRPGAALVARSAKITASLQWEDCEGGCKLLKTPLGVEPRAVIHFLGGVLVSPKPDGAYRYVLESLSSRGFVVVATPFAVDFDYRKPAAEVYEKFSTARGTLSSELRELPLLAMGHSLGALMQTLLICMHTEYSEACCGAALVSYNNKPASDAIPAFEQLFVPALAPLEPLTRLPAYSGAVEQAKRLRQFGFGLARAGLANTPAGASELVGTLDVALRDAEALASLTDQIPDVLASISQGSSEFSPTPPEIRTMVGASFAQRSPLVVQFTDDSLDESPAFQEALPDAVGARLVLLQGTHLTPLAVDPDATTSGLLPIPQALGPGLRSRLLGDADSFVDELDGYFTAALAQRAVEAAEVRAAEVAAARAAEAAARAAEAAAKAEAARVEAAKEAAAEAAVEAAREAAAKAAAAEAEAKASLREAASAKSAAKAQEIVEVAKAGAGTYSRLKAKVKAKKAAAEAEIKESAAIQAEKLAAVESRVAEIEAISARKTAVKAQRARKAQKRKRNGKE